MTCLSYVRPTRALMVLSFGIVPIFQRDLTPLKGRRRVQPPEFFILERQAAAMCSPHHFHIWVDSLLMHDFMRGLVLLQVQGPALPVALPMRGTRLPWCRGGRRACSPLPKRLRA